MSNDILLKSNAAVGEAIKTAGEEMSKGLPIMERGTRVKRRNITGDSELIGIVGVREFKLFSLDPPGYN